ncbi:MAG: LuxR C-terminal-related transcriptional regulator [Gammaproteobacteria bacterium]|nr:LuxR C-terminal-related transcriptional regulator [Gammaproteobacteria bacterium]
MTSQRKLSISQDQLQGLITQIYDSALEPALWNETLAHLTAQLGAEQGFFRVIDKNTNHVTSYFQHNRNLEGIESYLQHFIHIDPWLNNFLDNNNILSCTHHLLPYVEYQKLEYYNDYIKPMGLHYGIGGLIHLDSNSVCYMALNRDKARGEFSTDALSILRYLEPHISRSLKIIGRLSDSRAETANSHSALDQLNCPLLLVDDRENILFMNANAEAFITDKPYLSIARNRLKLDSPAEHKQFQCLIYSATHEVNPGSPLCGGAMRYQHIPSGDILSVLVMPINKDRYNTPTGRKSALVLISTNKQPFELSSERIQSLYGLTRSEARLATLLCLGNTLDSISEMLHISKNTLRSQLQSCFSKMGVKRQADLIQRALTGPAGIIDTSKQS